MSVAIKELLIDLSTKPAVKAQFEANPELVMESRGLELDEVQLMKSGDQKRIRQLLSSNTGSSTWVHVPVVTN